MENIKKKHFRTGDGSPTLYMEQFDEYYHSKHGAIQEANHVYLEMGLIHWKSLHPKAEQCHIFEMGYGTGLNAFLTAQKGEELNLAIQYRTIEAYPLSLEEIKEVNYDDFLKGDEQSLFHKINNTPWESLQSVTDHFSIHKKKCLLQEYKPKEAIDVLYYDAFGARSQPEIWEENCFQPLIEKMNPGGVFVTYAAKGSVRRALQKFGLEVSLVPGPPGKREMIQASRPLL